LKNSPTDFFFYTSQWESWDKKLVTHIQQKKELDTGLEQLKGE